jgi:hypothetical protein
VVLEARQVEPGRLVADRRISLQEFTYDSINSHCTDVPGNFDQRLPLQHFPARNQPVSSNIDLGMVVMPVERDLWNDQGRTQTHGSEALCRDLASLRAVVE